MSSLVIVERGNYRAIVGEHPDLVYLAVGGGSGANAMFLNPIEALRVATAIIEQSSRIIERQFQRQLGGP